MVRQQPKYWTTLVLTRDDSEIDVRVEGYLVKGYRGDLETPSEPDTFEDVKAIFGGIEIELTEREEERAVIALLTEWDSEMDTRLNDNADYDYGSDG